MAVLSEMRVDGSKLLTAAIVKFAEFWGMTDARLATVLGMPVSTVRRF